MQDALSAPQVGGVVKLMRFIIRTTFIIEAAGALILMTVYVPLFGVKGIWTSVFCSVSAFCNAGFDLSGAYSGHYSSLTSFYNDPVLIITVSALIITGGIGFMTWTDIAKNGIHLKRYRMQSKVILVTTLALIIIPTVIFYFEDFRSGSAADRFLLSFFQAVTPRTARIQFRRSYVNDSVRASYYYCSYAYRRFSGIYCRRYEDYNCGYAFLQFTFYIPAEKKRFRLRKTHRGLCDPERISNSYSLHFPLSCQCRNNTSYRQGLSAKGNIRDRVSCRYGGTYSRDHPGAFNHISYYTYDTYVYRKSRRSDNNICRHIQPSL
jgi:hypothetical protein